VLPKPPDGAFARMSGTRLVLPNEITFLAMPANGALMGAGSEALHADQTYPFTVWDAATGDELFRATEISSAAFDSRGTILVAAHRKGPIELIDTSTWKPRSTLDPCGGRLIEEVALAPDDKTLAVACDDTGIRLQPIDGGRAIKIVGTARASQMAWSHDGAWLAASDGYSYVWVIDVKTRAIKHTLKTTAFHGMAFAPNAPVLAFGDFTDTRLFDLKAGKERTPIAIDADELAFSRDGKQLAIAPITGAASLLVVDLATGAKRNILGPARKTSPVVAVDAAGRLWLAQDHGLRAFDMATGKVLLEPQGHRGPVTQLAYRRDGKVLASGSKDRTIRIWDLATKASTVVEVITDDAGGILPRKEDVAGWLKHPMSAATGLAWATDGSLIASDEYMLREWSGGSYLLAKARGLQHELGGVAILPDGSVLTLGYEKDQVSLRWTDRNGNQLRHADLEATSTYPLLRLVLSYDGKRVAVSGQTITVRDAATGALIADGNDSDPRGLALDATGNTLAIAGAGVLRVMRVGGAVLDLPRTPSFKATAIAITANAQRVIVGGAQGQVVVLDVVQASTTEHVGHVGAVRAIAIAPDGKSFATGADDGTIVTWALP